MTALSKNSWLLFRLTNHACPNNIIIDITAPYAIKLLPIIPWARHCCQHTISGNITCPRWSARQNPSNVIPPKPICTQLTSGVILPIVPWHMTAARRMYRLIPRSKWNLRYIPNTTCPINRKATNGAKLAWILWENWRPLCACPRNQPTTTMSDNVLKIERLLASTLATTCTGTCHRDFDNPRI